MQIAKGGEKVKYKGFKLKKSKIRTIEVCCGHGNKCNGKGRSITTTDLA